MQNGDNYVKTITIKSDLKYLFRPNIRLSKLERRRKRRGWALVIGLLLACIQLVLTVLFQITIFRLDILPMKYLIIINVILVLILLYDFTAQFSRSHMLGKFISVMLSVLILFSYLLLPNLMLCSQSLEKQKLQLI